MHTLAWIVLFTAIGGVASAVLAGAVLWLPEKLRTRLMPHMLSFATGALLAAALLALLPHAVMGAGPFRIHDIGIALLGVRDQDFGHVVDLVNTLALADDPEFAEKWSTFVVAEVIRHHTAAAANNR